MSASREDWVPELGMMRLVKIIQHGLDAKESAIEIAQMIIVAQRNMREELE